MLSENSVFPTPHSHIPMTLLPLVVNVLILADEVCTFRKAPNFYGSFPALAHSQINIYTNIHTQIKGFLFWHEHTHTQAYQRTHESTQQHHIEATAYFSTEFKVVQFSMNRRVVIFIQGN